MPNKMLYKAAVVGASVAAATALMTPAVSAQTKFPVDLGGIVTVNYRDDHNQFCVTTQNGGSAKVNLSPRVPGQGPVKEFVVEPYSTGCAFLGEARENTEYRWHVDGYYWADGSGTFLT